MFPDCCHCLELRIGSTALELYFWLLQAGFPAQRDSVMHFFCNIFILVNFIHRASSLLPQLNPSILISKYWQHYPTDYPPVGRCVGCLLQRVVWCQIYFCFIFQASRIHVEALVSSALLYAVLHMVAPWNCSQIHFPFLYLAIILFICLLAFWAHFLLSAFPRLQRLICFDRNTWICEAKTF